MKFYRFESQEQFMAFAKTDATEFVKDGVVFSVIGQIADGGVDDEGNPTFKPGWHVNASADVEGWKSMEVKPKTPSRVFG